MTVAIDAKKYNWNSNYNNCAFKVSYSDDGSSWQDVTSSDYITSDATTKYSIPDVGAHRYWIVRFMTGYLTSGAYYMAIKSLQFYSYAPLGNVSIMTANNAPYGTVKYSSEYGSPNYAYAAFNGFDSMAGWCPASNAQYQTTYIGYSFAYIYICVILYLIYRGKGDFYALLGEKEKQ